MVLNVSSQKRGRLGYRGTFAGGRETDGSIETAAEGVRGVRPALPQAGRGVAAPGGRGGRGGPARREDAAADQARGRDRDPAGGRRPLGRTQGRRRRRERR